MVTPSLVTSGEPVIFSRITLRPFGPSVLFTEAASCSTPACSRRRASAPNRSSLAMGPPGARGWEGRSVCCAGGTGRSDPAVAGGAPRRGGAAGPVRSHRAGRSRGSVGRGPGAGHLGGVDRLQVEADVLRG